MAGVALLRREQDRAPFPMAAAATQTERIAGGSSRRQEQRSAFRFRRSARNLVATKFSSTSAIASRRHNALRRSRDQ